MRMAESCFERSADDKQTRYQSANDGPWFLVKLARYLIYGGLNLTNKAAYKDWPWCTWHLCVSLAFAIGHDHSSAMSPAAVSSPSHSSSRLHAAWSGYSSSPASFLGQFTGALMPSAWR